MESGMSPPEYNKGPDQVIPTDLRYTHKIRDAVKIRVSPDEDVNIKPISVPTLLKNTADRWPDRDALCVKRDGSWEKMSFSQYYQQSRTAAKALIQLGLRPFGGVAIMGFNSPEYLIANMAAIMAGGISTGVYTTSSASTCQFYLTHTEISVVVVENDKYLQLIMEIKHACPLVQVIVQYSGTPAVEGVLSWDEFMATGDGCDDSLLEDRLRGIAVNQCCSVIYTSGTVGQPKGVMISHDVVTWTAEYGSHCCHATDGQDTVVSYLPLCHGAAQIFDVYSCLRKAVTLYFAQPDALKGSLIQTLREVRPTLFLGVPRIFEKMYEKLKPAMLASGLLAGALAWCRRQAEDHWQRKELDIDIPYTWSMSLADLLLSRVREKIGLDQVRHVGTSAAPISTEVISFIHSLNIPLYELYGLSETFGPCTANDRSGFKLGSIGRRFTGCLIRILNPDEDGNGEILHWGRNVFMGYLGCPEATSETIDEDDWLHTGDVGRLDADGYVTITGRIKELLITAGGKNVAPVPIEDAVKAHLPVVSNCVVVGDRRKFLAALLTLKVEMNPETGEATDTLHPIAKHWLKSRGVQATTVKEAIQHLDQYRSDVQKAISAANSEAESHSCWVQKWCVLPTEFSIPGGELGPTLKIRRKVVMEKFSAEVEAFYSG